MANLHYPNMDKEIKPLDFTSPIAKMFFGKHKDSLMYQIPMGSLEHYKLKFNITRRSHKTLTDAATIGMHIGEWAILRKYHDEKFFVTLQDIVPTEDEAKFALVKNEVYEDFVYHILPPTE